MAAAARRPENEALRMHGAVRIAVAGLFCSLAANIGLAGALLMLLPLKHVVPYIVQARGPEGDRLVEIIPVQVTESISGALLKGEVERYVRFRNEIVESQRFMVDRWGRGGFVAFRSSEDVYQDFLPEAGRIIDELGARPHVREVEIEHSSPQASDPNLWTVRFRTWDHRGVATDQRRLARRWTAYLEIGQRAWSPETTEREFVANPLGLVVVKYSVIEDAPRPPPSAGGGGGPGP